MNEREVKITDTLRDFGVTANLNGYKYLKYAIEFMLHQSAGTKVSTMFLYEEVAEEFDTSTHCVERACRYAIHEGWMYCDKDKIHSVFGNNEDVPTTGKFIRIISNYLRMLLKEE